jgi:hypothetical protein
MGCASSIDLTEQDVKIIFEQLQKLNVKKWTQTSKPNDPDKHHQISDVYFNFRVNKKNPHEIIIDGFGETVLRGNSWPTSIKGTFGCNGLEIHKTLKTSKRVYVNKTVDFLHRVKQNPLIAFSEFTCTSSYDTISEGTVSDGTVDFKIDENAGLPASPAAAARLPVLSEPPRPYIARTMNLTGHKPTPQTRVGPPLEKRRHYLFLADADADDLAEANKPANRGKIIKVQTFSDFEESILRLPPVNTFQDYDILREYVKTILNKYFISVDSVVNFLFDRPGKASQRIVLLDSTRIDEQGDIVGGIKKLVLADQLYRMRGEEPKLKYYLFEDNPKLVQIQQQIISSEEKLRNPKISAEERVRIQQELSELIDQHKNEVIRVNASASQPTNKKSKYLKYKSKYLALKKLLK